MSPKGFTERERDTIQEKLLTVAMGSLQKAGIRKTTVEDLTKAAGISKGLFYSFWNSKEEMYFELFERLEQNVKDYFINTYQALDGTVKDKLKNALKTSVKSPEMAAFLTIRDSGDLDYMILKLSPETVQTHFGKDNDFLSQMTGYLPIRLKAGADVVSAHLRALFVLMMCPDIIGKGYLESVTDSYIDMIIEKFVEEQ